MHSRGAHCCSGYEQHPRRRGVVRVEFGGRDAAGYSLSRFRSRAQEIAGLSLLISKMLPGSIIVIPFFIMASTFGVIDNRLALILANTSVGVPSRRG